MKWNKKIAGYFVLALVLMTSCAKDGLYKGDEGSGLTPGDVFDFSTVQSVQLNVNYDVPQGFRAYFEAYTENPIVEDQFGNYMKKEGVKPFLTGYTDEKGDCKLPVDLPSYVNEVYVYSAIAGVPVLLNGKIENKAVTVRETFAGTKALTKGGGNNGGNNVYYSNWVKQNLSLANLYSYDKQGRFDNMVEIEMSKQTMDIINATIPKGENLDLRFCGASEITISEDAKVSMYYVSDGSARKNALAYYIYTGERPTQQYINDNLILLFPCLHNSALKAGDGLVLKYRQDAQSPWMEKFPAGTKIGFVLLVDAWEESNGEVISQNINVMYSEKTYNKYRFPNLNVGDRPQMAMFGAGEDFILSFEDQPWSESPQLPYPGDFRDNIFVLKADPEGALPDVNPGQDPEEPEGIFVAANRGVLAFEDVWPYKGDYDMNDVVVKYVSGMYGDFINDEVTALVDTFTFMNNGAKYKDGFGYQLPVETSNIEKVEFTSTYQCDGQGLDKSLDKATIMLFDNGLEVPQGTVFTVRVWFKNPVSYITVFSKNPAPYNPFITVESFLGENRKEVHLVNYAPTTKANMDLLNYGHDLSNPAQGIYYVSDADFPFAINITGVDYYRIPAENHQINEFYPDFSKWVNSKGTDYKDWYLRPVAE